MTQSELGVVVSSHQLIEDLFDRLLQAQRLLEDGRIGRWELQPKSFIPEHNVKSAHTALAVKACLLGCNSATLNAQVTFVYIAVAISALAGGGI